MTRKLMSIAAVMAALLISTSGPVIAQTASAPAKTTKKKVVKETTSEREIRELREQMQAQQSQIDALQSQLSSKTAQASSAQQAATDAQTKADAAAASAQQATSAASDAAAKTDSLTQQVNDMKSTEAGVQETIINNQKNIMDAIDSPLALHYKGVTITPGGFVAAEGVWRQHSVNSDINTPLNSIPFPGANEGHVSELNFSGRQSRLSALVQADTGKFKLTGYYEMDWLGTGTSSNNNQSNSYVLRQRQIWGKVETQGGFAMTGGQMWSLVTEDRKGTDTRTEIQPQTIDSQYLVGYNWTRQPGFRVQQRFGDLNTGAFTIAAAVEQAQITNFTASGIEATSFYFGGIGQNGGLYNAAAAAPANNVAASVGAVTTYANNVIPDILVKAAYDAPKFHFEVGGIARFFRDYYFPITYGTGTTVSYGTNEQSHTSTGGGVFASARAYLGKSEVALQGMAGTGTGRYGSSQLADVTLRPDETLEPIRNYHLLFSNENHLTSKLDVFEYYGGEYAQRTVYALPNGVLTGYAPQTLNNSGCYASPVNTGLGNNGAGGSLSVPANCTGSTRYIQEAMGGLTWKAINSPKYGRLQYSLTYSYIQRNLWSGSGGQPSAISPAGPRATDPMVHIGMRYYLP
jgi:hypothetical protein